jgi:hypothetical protein
MRVQSETAGEDKLLLPQPGSLIKFKRRVIWYLSNHHGFKPYKENEVPVNHVYFVVSCIAKHPSEYTATEVLSIDGWCNGQLDEKGSLRMLITVLYRGKLCVIQASPVNVILLPQSK